MPSTYRLSWLLAAVILLWCVRFLVANAFGSVQAVSFLLLADLANFAVSLKAIAALEKARSAPIYADQPASLVYVLPAAAGLCAIFDLRALVNAF